MKKLLTIMILLIGGLLQSCQCSDKPEIGPVEDESRVANAVSVAT